MAQLQLQPAATGKNSHMMRHQPRIDMTPMVDLGFLLITFFIFTTTMADHRVEPIVVPADTPSARPNKTAASATVNVVLGNDNKVFFYTGKWEDAVATNAIVATTYNVYTGLGNLIRAKQNWLDKNYKEKRDGLILLIKPTDASTYQNFIHAMDEVAINNIKTYVVMQPSFAETNYALLH